MKKDNLDNPKIIPFDNSVERYLNIANKNRELGQNERALGFLFSALKLCPKNLDVILEIANVYTEMELFEQANQFLFYYLSICTKEQAIDRYESLGINFYYMDNYFASSVYFHQKLEADGFLSNQEFSEEINKFIEESSNIRSLYYLAYPYDKANYEFKLKNARRAFSSGDYLTSAKIYSSIPKEVLDQESFGDLAVSYYMCDRDKEVIEACNDSLSYNGENLTAYANLAMLYKTKGDVEKADYYYKKALEFRGSDAEEHYNLVACAIEQRDHKTALECVQKILVEKPFDPMMWFFQGVANVNLGNFSEGAKSFKKAYLLCPYENIFEFYTEYFIKANNDGKDFDGICPLKYEKQYPSSYEESFKKTIKELESQNKSVQKTQKNIQALKWGIYHGDVSIAKSSAYLLSLYSPNFGQKLLSELLIDSEVNDERKKLIIFALILSGTKKKFGVVATNIFLKVKPKKLVFEECEEGIVFVWAYAYAMSRLAFWGVDDFDKVGYSVNKLFNRYALKILDKKLSYQEIAFLVVKNCNFKHIKDLKRLAMAFDVDLKKVEEFLDNKQEKNND